MSKECAKKALICAISVQLFMTGHLHADEDVFLDGLPDVPQLEMVTAIEGEPVIFDTPAGTVAEYRLLVSTTSDEAIAAYNSALTGLGWACTEAAYIMTCAREENRLVFTQAENEADDHRIILRLEPVE